MSKIKFRSRYDESIGKIYSTDVGEDPSLTEQCFKDECDINNIVLKPNLGINPFNQSFRKAQYGDFTDLKTFQEAANIVANANSHFEQLPSYLRRRFHDTPAELLAFINDPANIEEGVQLGIYEKSALDKIKPAEKQAQVVSQPIPSTIAESSAQ